MFLFHGRTVLLHLTVLRKLRERKRAQRLHRRSAMRMWPDAHRGRMRRCAACGCASTTITTARGSPIARPGTGPPLVLLHSLGLSHREWEPIVAPLSARFRVVLPDLPLHGDSEDRPRHPYTPRLAGRGDRRLLPRGRRTAAAASPATTSAPSSRCERSRTGQLEPARLVLMPNRLHRRDEYRRQARGVAGGVPGRRAARARPRCSPTARSSCSGPSLGERLSAQRNPARATCPPRVRRRRRQRQPRPLVGEVRPPLARRAPAPPARRLSRIDVPVLLLWADEDRAHPARRPPRRRSTCCPTPSCGRCPGPAS